MRWQRLTSRSRRSMSSPELYGAARRRPPGTQPPRARAGGRSCLLQTGGVAGGDAGQRDALDRAQAAGGLRGADVVAGLEGRRQVRRRLGVRAEQGRHRHALARCRRHATRSLQRVEERPPGRRRRSARSSCGSSRLPQAAPSLVDDRPRGTAWLMGSSTAEASWPTASRAPRRLVGVYRRPEKGNPLRGAAGYGSS